MTTNTAAPATTRNLPALDTLRRTTAGPVLIPGDDGYADEVFAWNARTVHRPDLVVGAVCADDVVAAMRYAIRHGLPVAVQATGHGATDAVDGGLLLSTRRMTEVRVDPHTRLARVAAGAKWAAVVEAATSYGLAPLSGSTTDVGAVGYTLGGGMGPLGRRYGFAADRVRSIEVVTGDGRLRTVTADDDTGLFWGLRGGKGNLGVVTALEIELLPVARLYGGALFFSGDDAPAVLESWRLWVGDAPEELSSSIALMRLPDVPDVPPPLRGRLSVHVRVAYLGSAEDGERLVAPLRAVAPSLLDGVREMAFREVDSIHLDPVQPMPTWHIGTLLSAFPLEAVDRLLEVAGPEADVPLIMAEVRQMGGALARPPAVPSAVSGRGAAFSVFTLGPGVPGVQAAVEAAGHRLVDALAPWRADEQLVNFLGSGLAPDDVAAAYATDVAVRLQELKERFDPHGLLRHGHTLRARVATAVQP